MQIQFEFRIFKAAFKTNLFKIIKAGIFSKTKIYKNMPTDPKVLESTINSPEFKKLVSRRWAVSIALTFTILFIYIGFLLVVAFKKEVLATDIGNNYTLAIPVGVGIIFSAWLLTGIYVYWANNSYDSEVQSLKENIRL